MAKLSGAYKGTRKRKAPPVLIRIECPGCGWKSQGAPQLEAELEYVCHLNNVHHGILECAFCIPDRVGRGVRCLPDFPTLAEHVRTHHAKAAAEIMASGVWKSGPLFEQLQNQQRGDAEMALALPTGSNRSGSTPGKKQDYLQDADVKTPVTAKIVDAKPGTGRQAVILKLKLPQGTRFDSMSTDNPNFRILFEAFGGDEAQWKGKTVSIGLEHDTFTERDWRRYSVGK